MNEIFDKSWHVFVLAPCLKSDNPTLQYYYDYSQAKPELNKAFDELGLSWTWRSVTIEDYQDAVHEITQVGGQKLVFNLCDGDEINEVPGICVVRALQDSGLVFTGAREAFYDVTASKIAMKVAFEKAGVDTPEWLNVETQACRAFEKVPGPLIVKPALSGGSMGISIKSVVHNNEELHAQIEVLKAGCHGWNTSKRGIYAERFVRGREFTTFIVGSSRVREHATVFAPIERIFHASLPEHERFLTFDRSWEFYESEAPLQGGAPLYDFAPIEDARLREEIRELSFKAYQAVQGTGYTRVDLRRDDETGILYVLEVNAQCGLSEDENFTDIGAIIRFEKRRFSEVLMLIMIDAIRESRR